MKVVLRTKDRMLATVHVSDVAEVFYVGDEVFVDEKNQGQGYFVEASRTRVDAIAREVYTEVTLKVKSAEKMIPLTTFHREGDPSRNKQEVWVDSPQKGHILNKLDNPFNDEFPQIIGETKNWRELKSLESDREKLNKVRDYLYKVIDYSSEFLNQNRDDEVGNAYYRSRRHLADYLIRVEMGEDIR